jgi:nucleotide-binding universal stress UspA family protein
MKTILVPTDFSAYATNALYYALALARQTGAKVYVLHVCAMPIAGPSLTLSSIESISAAAFKEAKARMVTLFDELNQEGYFNIEALIRMGFLDNELLDVALQFKADLIVMGTRGATGLVDSLFGSNTAAIIDKKMFPVLAIPSGASYKPLHNMVMAADYHPLSHAKVLAPMLELSAATGAHINVLYIDKHPDSMSKVQCKAEEQLERILVEYEPTFHFSAESDVFKGINEFIKEENSGMLVMIARKKNVLQQLLNRSHTRHMALHSTVPLLVLPEKADLEIYA